jgi:hypothetical protein
MDASDDIVKIAKINTAGIRCHELCYTLIKSSKPCLRPHTIEKTEVSYAR